MQSDPVFKIIVHVPGLSECERELGERLTIGRSSQNELVLGDSNASRRHAEIRRISGRKYRLIDLGSANGTWVNGRRVTSPRDLAGGDRIAIGDSVIEFIAPDIDPTALTDSSLGESTQATSTSMRNETIVIQVCDIRNYTGMSEALPADEFSGIISDWFKECTRIVENQGGTVDKFIGDAVMAYWIVADPDRPGEEVSSSLIASRKMIDMCELFTQRIQGLSKKHKFRVGIGLNVGPAIFGNIGTPETPSFTVVGDSVNLAFRLETLSKEKGEAVLVSKPIAENASKWFKFKSLGKATVKGKAEPVEVSSLILKG